MPSPEAIKKSLQSTKWTDKKENRMKKFAVSACAIVALLWTSVASATPFFVQWNPIISATKGQPYVYQVSAIFPAASPSFSLLAAPAGMTIDSSGKISWTPTVTGKVTVKVQVSDQGGAVARDYDINVQ